ncbi:hypothetical protein [Streptomyces sp. Tu 3180]|uniref:hypothetical protein n=1 Tax=Streptomyces sp. Tu 3180 TaxID=2682611 RepID=UPI00135BBA23|nr:hypothetical protein [Streptomyces sp. Tu 3180]KAF3467667.1 hypothetical protein GL259_27430 [Streptomyces sp. Tu 3180]
MHRAMRGASVAVIAGAMAVTAALSATAAPARGETERVNVSRDRRTGVRGLADGVGER